MPSRALRKTSSLTTLLAFILHLTIAWHEHSDTDAFTTVSLNIPTSSEVKLLSREMAGTSILTVRDLAQPGST